MKIFTTSVTRFVQRSLLLICCAAPPLASAEIINFDDLTTEAFAAIPNGYHGYDWQNMYVFNRNFAPGSGYDFGTMSGAYTGYNWYDYPATFSRQQAFTLASIQVTKAWFAGFTHFEGYVGTVLKYSKDVYSTTSGPTTVVFDWTELTSVTMYDGDQTYHTAIENVNVMVVPEPGSYAMLLAGLAGLGMMLKLRSSKADGDSLVD